MRLFFKIIILCGLGFSAPSLAKGDVYGLRAHEAALYAGFVDGFEGAFTPGGLVWFHLKAATYLTLNDERVPVFNNLAIIGFDRDAPASVRLGFHMPTRAGDGGVRVLRVKLRPRQFDEQYIEGIAPALVSPPPEALARIKLEGRQKRAARSHIIKADWMRAGFIAPLAIAAPVTGVYGSRRFFNGKPRRPHYGVDFAAPAHTKVRASAKGRVRLAEPDMYFEGGLIFIDHGLSVISAYLHLAQINVRAGDMVEAGDIIGAVGGGGRSTGAHLDWRIYWNGRHIDPQLALK